RCGGAERARVGAQAPAREGDDREAGPARAHLRAPEKASSHVSARHELSALPAEESWTDEQLAEAVRAWLPSERMGETVATMAARRFLVLRVELADARAALESFRRSAQRLKHAMTEEFGAF